MDDREVYEKRVGTTLRDKWTIERLLGVGGMAAVYVGVHQLRGPEALKVLHSHLARNKELKDRFVQEAKVLSGLLHPGVVKVLDIDKTEDGAPFIAMELLDGESLTDRARRLDGIAVDEMLRYVDELLDVLATAHEMGIIHRDIKLDNLFIQKDGSVKVLDFGVARLRASANKVVQTRAGAMLGTLPYMPPEQVRGQDVDARADLFAVGATMFRLVAKKRIHDATTESEMLVKMATLPAPPLGSVAKAAAPPLCLVVDRALAFRREERYPSARHMQEDVRALRRGEAPAYATARLAGALPNDPEPPQPQAEGRVSYGDVPTVVPGTRRTAHAATVSLAASEQGAGAASARVPSEQAQPPAMTKGGTLVMSQSSLSARGLPSADASVGPPSASASTLVSVLPNAIASADRPVASIRVTEAPAVPATPSPHDGDPAASGPRAAPEAISMAMPTTLGTGQPLPRSESRGHTTQLLLALLFAGIAALAIITGGLFWYFYKESAGQAEKPAAVPVPSSTAVSTAAGKPQSHTDVPAVTTTPSPDASGKKKPSQWRVQGH